MTLTNWTAAPAWATVKLRHVSMPHAFSWAEHYAEDARTVRVGGGPEFGLQMNCWDVIAQRTVWDGAGLPPAGTACEVWHDTGRECWAVARIVGHHPRRPGIVAAVLNDDRLIWCATFRPLRTPEQIAAEQRDRALDLMLEAAGVTGSAFANDPEALIWAAALYDAGYRKC